MEEGAAGGGAEFQGRGLSDLEHKRIGHAAGGVKREDVQCEKVKP